MEENKEEIIKRFLAFIEEKGMCIAGLGPPSPLTMREDLIPLHPDDFPEMIADFLKEEGDK